MKKKIVFILFFLFFSRICKAYISIIGIPDPPSVLMDADVDMYLGQTYNFSLDGRGVQTYPVSSSGHPYTHYIDKDDPNATDTDNPYGTEAVPRLTLPFQEDAVPGDTSKHLAAGSVMEVHNGTYTFSNEVSVYSNGTSSNPVFFRGEDNATIQSVLFYFNGSYMVIENIAFYKAAVRFYYVSATVYQAPDHQIIRNCELYDDGDTPSPYSAIAVYGLSGAGNIADNLVIYNNHIHHHGQYDVQPPTTGHDWDSSGVILRDYVQYIWIIDNHIHHNGGDSIQLGNYSNRNTQQIYIGNNIMHDDRENPIDVKESQDVIISHNTMYNYTKQGRTDDGGGIPMHQGTIAGEDCPKNIWVIFNKLYNVTTAGFSIHRGININIIGNLIYNIPEYVPYADASYAIRVSVLDGGETHNVINNTIYNCENGFSKNIETDVYGECLIANNIFYTLSEGTSGRAHVSIEDVPTNVTMDYNCYYQAGGTERIYWIDTGYSLSEFQSAISQETNGVAGDPLFVSPGSDFHLQEGSPAQGTAKTDGIIATIYSTFQSTYGVSIKYDIDGNALPDTGRSMGAYQGEGSSTKYLLLWTGN